MTEKYNSVGNIFEKKYCDEFKQIIGELLKFEEVRKLSKFSQHLNTNRLLHSINVAHYSYKISKKLGFDYVSATRAAMLHDLFLYDWRVEKQPEGAHAFAHPKVALRTAKSIVELNKIEEDAIVKHMWPVTLKLPKYKESYVVTFSDKFSTIAEVAKRLTDVTLKRYYTMKQAVMSVL